MTPTTIRHGLRRLLPLCLVTCCAGAPGAADARATDPPKDVSALLNEIIGTHDVPGMVAVVIEDGRVVATGAAGVRKRGGRDKVTLNDKFHVGSCTKAMTASLCAKLVEGGKLRWDTTVGQALADVKPMHAGWRNVTLEQLLQHRGGAPAEVDAALWSKLWGLNGTPARRFLAQGVLAKPPAAEPGTTYAYSNAGYAIAGHMAEKAARKPWEDLMREHVFGAIGMTGAGFGAPTGASAPRGHRVDGTPVEPTVRGADNPPAIGPGGTVHCTVGDWGKFVAWHLAAAGRADRSLQKLHQPPEGGNYAMGWIVTRSPLGEGTALTHAGSNTMWYAVAWILPKQNVAVVVMCNQGGPGGPGDKACDEAVGKLVRAHQKTRAKE